MFIFVVLSPDRNPLLERRRCSHPDSSSTPPDLRSDRVGILSPTTPPLRARGELIAEQLSNRSIFVSPGASHLPLALPNIHHIYHQIENMGAKPIKGNTGRARQSRLLKRVGTVLGACFGVIVVVEMAGVGRHSPGSRHRRRKG